MHDDGSCIEEIKYETFFDFLRGFNHERTTFPFLQPKEIEEFNRLSSDISDPAVLELLTEPRILDKILQQRFDKGKQTLLRKEKRSSEVKQAFVLLLIQRKLLREESSFNEMEWKQKFYEIVYPKLQLLNKCKMEFASQSELIYLVRFYYITVLLNDLLPPKQNKNLFIRVAGELDGSMRKYVTGGKNSPETQRRAEIYELVTGVRPRFRDNSRSSTTTKKSKRETSSGHIKSSSKVRDNSRSSATPNKSNHETSSGHVKSSSKIILMDSSSSEDEESHIEKYSIKPSFELTLSPQQRSESIIDLESDDDDEDLSQYFMHVLD